ncbi:acetylglutamate kinase [Formosa sp. Hel1_33_131]|uniref:acetylglutamate kinase n=1 Tax=Formosa sp. Hel1_33_131 TaxID=1336794 RepID=UPI00084E266E|nr:acetylglutamate kinase [Formosa sp. Hel1_33_131]AOR27397.1 acetylglutamate kinase [Formosa sp. Hel1_33_131]
MDKKNTLKIVKIGGNVIDNPQALTSFLTVFSSIKGPKILVHGGGKSATALAKKTGLEVQMVDGRRITDAATLELITMVYAGKINKTMVAQLQALDCNALGFTGADANTITSVKRPVSTLDYGFVGDVKNVETSTLELLLNHGISPVFCALTHNQNGQLLNTNADTIASELAIAFASQFEVELYYCFEKNGVLKDVNDDSSVIEKITASSYKELLHAQVIYAGMLPKLNNCFHALEHQVSKVCIGKPEMLLDSEAIFTTLTIQ